MARPGSRPRARRVAVVRRTRRRAARQLSDGSNAFGDLRFADQNATARGEPLGRVERPYERRQPVVGDDDVVVDECDHVAASGVDARISRTREAGLGESEVPNGAPARARQRLEILCLADALVDHDELLRHLVSFQDRGDGCADELRSVPRADDDGDTERHRTRSP